MRPAADKLGPANEDVDLIEMLIDNDDIVCGMFLASPNKRMPTSAMAGGTMMTAKSTTKAAVHRTRKGGQQHDPCDPL
jgi:hypothetical protein